MKSFGDIILFSLFQFIVLVCNTHGLYRVKGAKCSIEKRAMPPIATSQNNALPGKLVIGSDVFKIQPEWDRQEVINQARLLVLKLPSPFICIERDIDCEYYCYRPSEDYPDSLGRQISHGVSSDRCIVGNSGKKYYLDPLGNRFSRRCPSDEQAYYVSQGEVCYGTDAKMGTDNVQNCVALIIQDKHTRKTALAHLSTTSLYLVDEILDYMPKGPKNVILVGGQHRSGEHNLNLILKSLLQYNDTIHVVRSYCGNTGSLLFNDADKNETVTISFYDINTNFGNVIVNPKDLKITTDRATRKIPSNCKIRCAHYDLDKIEQ